MATTYDVIGRAYTSKRKPDPRIAEQIIVALAESSSVVNVGAGAGSYEPQDRACLAIEPSRVMIEQRKQSAAPAVQGRAECLPLADDCVDAAMAVLTIHHWADAAAGLGEMRRIARHRTVVMCWDQEVWQSFWLFRDYFPDCDIDQRRAVPITDVVAALGGAQVQTLLIPQDCIDGFNGAYWARPEAYLDPNIRAGISTFAEMSQSELDRGLVRLAKDIESGEWFDKNQSLTQRKEIDLGYRIVIGGV